MILTLQLKDTGWKNGFKKKNPTAVYKKPTSPHWQDAQRLKEKETNITSKWSMKTNKLEWLYST
jgi:hypothetical protein